MTDTISLAAMVDRLAQRVCVCIGLDPQMVRDKISRYLGDISPEERLTLLQIADTELFSMPPWERFVESLLVHETYFFRHPDQLLYLRDHALADYLAARPRQKTLLLWCAGASTGEDAYTFAFLASEVLAQAGLDPYGFELLATDLSEACLNQAGTGQFQLQPGFGSFRTIPEFAQHHFHGLSVPGASEWVVPDPTRRRVRVERHNLLDPPPILSVDILICRNTLIYFTTEARQRVLQAMSHALIPGGVLILGPADDASCVAGLELWGANAPFIFRKVEN
jgi:chemotaxis methyl-accepting protein methylase